MGEPTGNGPAYVERRPRTDPVPLVVSIPHTGTDVPPDVVERFATPAITALPMTDWHLHELYDFLPELGVTSIHARWSRLVIDLNRPPDATPLYPGRFETGLVPLETFQGEPIFRTPPTAAETEVLRTRFHAPYHARLSALLDEHRARFGRVVLIDAHSVASAPSRVHDRLENDVYLGDRDGSSCGPWLMSCLQSALRDEGLTVAVNNPYKGGYTTAHYGDRSGVEAIQIEMCQRVYMDEDRPADAVVQPAFARSSALLERVFRELIDRLGREESAREL